MKWSNNVEKTVVLEKYGQLLWGLRMPPHHAARWLFGIFLPPHERLGLVMFFAGYKENNVVWSRGTSKTFTFGSLAAPLACTLNKNFTPLLLSASGFRGGKEVLRDSERLFLGQLRDQRLPGAYAQVSLASAKPIEKDPSMWAMKFKSLSRYPTVPTNNPDQLRGLRSLMPIIDERNTFPGDIVQKIVRPTNMVGSSFRRPGQAAEGNRIWQQSTIDLTVRDWYPEIQVAQDLQRREYAAWQARQEGDWEEYDRLLSEKDGQLRGASFYHSRLDYTDLLIPEVVTTYDGTRRVRVDYPLEPGVLREHVLVTDETDGTAYWYTYPVDKKGAEEPLRNGTTDEEIWRAEYRNVFISASGTIFPYELIQQVAERPIWTAKETPGTKRKRREDEEDDPTREEYFAPVLYECGDPCVLGVDYARETDESAIVVIRLGELAEGEFDPFEVREDKEGRPVLGKTPWNHIVWAQSWRHLEADAFADIIRDFMRRYNVIHTPTVAGIGLDQRGGGGNVRDALGNPKPTVVNGEVDPKWDFAKVLKIYDPEDEKGFSHYRGYTDPQYWGGLRLLMTTQEDNDKWTLGARAWMQARKLFLGFWQPESRWAREKGFLTAMGEPDRLHPEYVKWAPGYEGLRRLKMQLLRLQTKLTETGKRKYLMPGDRNKEEGKKDLWAAMIYATGLAREHTVAKTKAATSAPNVDPVIVELPGLRLF
jgi:hypothetical protein